MLFAARFESVMVANGRGSFDQFRGKRPQSHGFRRLAPTNKLTRDPTQMTTKSRLPLPTLDPSAFCRRLCTAPV